MSVDKQIVCALDQLHRELTGEREKEACRWQYKGGTDNYSCHHLSLSGKTVIEKVESFNSFPNQK